MVFIDIKRRTIKLTNTLANLAQMARDRPILITKFQNSVKGQFPFVDLSPQTLSKNTLKKMIQKYSEQIVFQPLNEVEYWFTYKSGAFIEPGYPPLFYHRVKNKPIVPNISAVASIGEAIAGFLSQRLYMCRKIARPILEFPDIIMGKEDIIYLVEAKASVEKNFSVNYKDVFLRFISFVCLCGKIERRSVIGLLIKTNLLDENNYISYITEVVPP